DRQSRLDPLVLEIIQRVEKGDVRLGEGFVDHLLAVWPSSSLADIGKMTVQDEGEVAPLHRETPGTRGTDRGTGSKTWAPRGGYFSRLPRSSKSRVLMNSRKTESFFNSSSRTAGVCSDAASPASGGFASLSRATPALSSTVASAKIGA